MEKRQQSLWQRTDSFTLIRLRSSLPSFVSWKGRRTSTGGFTIQTLCKLSAPHTLLLRAHIKTSRPMDLTETRESRRNKHVFITRRIPTSPLSQDEIDLLHSFHVHGCIGWEIIIVYGERKEVKSSTQAHFRRNIHTRQVTELWI